jgi:hypothetical protein
MFGRPTREERAADRETARQRAGAHAVARRLDADAARAYRNDDPQWVALRQRALRIRQEHGITSR